MKKILTAAAVCLCLSGSASAGGEVERVLVVYNGTVAASISLAREYAAAHNIPDAQLCAVPSPASDAVERPVYERAIEQPVAECLTARNLQDRILFLAIMQGVPVWILGDAGAVGDLASVDSEMALLYRRLTGQEPDPFGKVDNPYFQEDPAAPVPPFRRDRYDMYLVTRLAGFSFEDARRLFGPASPAADGRALVGIDLRAPRGALIHDWVAMTVRSLIARGHRVELTETGVPPVSEAPFDLFLLVASSFPAGPEVKDLPNRLAERALGLVLPGGGSPPVGQGEWLTWTRSAAFELIARGAAGSAYFVADPSVDGFPRPQILFPAYLAGRNLAESFYAASRYLSWRTVVLGDPLRRARPPAEPPETWVERVDPATGWSEPFATRRKDNIVHRYQTSAEAAGALVRAEAAYQRGQGEEALRWAEEAVRLDPRVVDAHLLHARLLEAARRWEEAALAYERSLELHPPREANVLESLVRILVDRLKQPKRAESHAAQLLKARGAGDPEAARLWGRVLLGLERFEEAQGIFALWVKHSADPPAFALEGLGDVARRRGDPESARSFYVRALAAPGADTGEIRRKLALLPSAEPGIPEIDPSDGELSEPVKASQTPAERPDTGSSRESVEPARIANGASLDQTQVVSRPKGKSGRVVLRLFLDEHGQLLEVEPVAGDKSLYREAREAVRSWRYVPKLVNGRAVADWVTVTIEFRREQG
ncbi:MAG TPA: TIGR03790 family protein [Acidobacteriota bacterium]|nr:TIGR03790 family protein [Acidobacteriota bacterium]